MLESDMLANIDVKRQPNVAEVARSILKGAQNRKIRTTLNSRQSPTSSKDRSLKHRLQKPNSTSNALASSQQTSSTF
jgi:hypothetical protein